LETTCNQLAIFPRLFTIKSWDAIALSMGEVIPIPSENHRHFPKKHMAYLGAVPYFQTKPYLSTSLIISAKNHRVLLSKACIRGGFWPLKLDDQHMENGD
jgi:hypothetical protein